MIDYLNLKNSYIATIQMGLMLNTSYEDVKHGNDFLHQFCKSCVENSSYSENDKQNMKYDLEFVKEALAQEIEKYYHSN